MLPELWKIPFFDIPIKSYGFMLMMGFLVCIWLSMQRAMRVKADPDLILNVGFVSLMCGVGGARVFFVLHYWKTDFAWQPNPLWSAINLTSGGLEYYGGLVGAVLGVIFYLRFVAKTRAVGDSFKVKPFRRPSVRLYLDIVAPAVMLGLAFGRAGCFLNGCCWGGICAHQEEGQYVADLPWALTFPFASGAQTRQWENRQLRVPAELIYDSARNVNAPYLLWPDSLAAGEKELEQPARKFHELSAAYLAAAKKDPKSAETSKLKEQMDQAQQNLLESTQKHFTIAQAMAFQSRENPGQAINTAELNKLAGQSRSLPVHPAQLYGLINAVLLSVMLGRLFSRRKRHGVVFGAMLMLYPITRTILELVRVDNPHDVGGLTISQAVSLGMFLAGAAYMVILFKALPPRSVRALPAAPLLPPSEQ